MKSALLTAAAMAFTATFATGAMADDNCKGLITKEWMAIDKAISKAEGMGYAVKEAKRSDGCWEIEGFDRNGAEIEIKLNPATGEVVKPRGYRAPAS